MSYLPAQICHRKLFGACSTTTCETGCWGWGDNLNKEMESRRKSELISPPTIKLCIEQNQRYGNGYQVRILIGGVLDSVIDDEPIALIEACKTCLITITQINEEKGCFYEPLDVINMSNMDKATIAQSISEIAKIFGLAKKD